MELNLIWAQDRARAIGRGNKLPWRLPEDLAHFKRTTVDSVVIMGRKTFESLPNGALPHRTNIVLTRRPGSIATPNALQVDSLEAALSACAASSATRAFVIGGEAVYASALSMARRIYVTEVDLEVADADAHAPAIPASFVGTDPMWAVSTSGLRYRFRLYEPR